MGQQAMYSVMFLFGGRCANTRVIDRVEHAHPVCTTVDFETREKPQKQIQKRLYRRINRFSVFDVHPPGTRKTSTKRSL